MSRNIRWRLQFKSLNGTGCLVNIYDEDYTSSADTTKTGTDVPFAAETGVTLLTGAASPFEWEEDDDSSLLQVLRYRTGYLRVIEEEYGSLVDLYPATNTSHYVEFFYGSNLNFTGYMQAQSFEDDWVAAPRQLDFPIISPLGIADGKTFNVINPPTSELTLAVYLAEAINGLGGSYERVVFPDFTHSVEGTISSLVVCPHSSEFSQSYYIQTPVFDPITYAEFIEGICNAFGWICHDTPKVMVFSMFDWDGHYCQYDIGKLPRLQDKTQVQPDGNRKFALDNYVTVAGDDGKVANILPLKAITVDFGGEFVKSASYDFTKWRYILESNYSNIYAAFFEVVDGSMSGSFLVNNGNGISQDATYWGTLFYDGATPAMYGGKNSQQYGILIQMKSTVSSSRFNVIFAERPTASTLSLHIDALYGSKLNNLVTADQVTGSYLTLYYNVRVGDQYYQGNGQWSTSAPNPWQFYPLVDDFEMSGVPNGEIVLEFRLDTTSIPDNFLMALTDISVYQVESLYAEFKEYIQNETTLIGAAGSNESGQVSKLFSYERKNSHMIGSTVYSSTTSYPYLRASAQTRLQVPFRAKLPSNPYQPMFSYWIDGWRWRLIAMAFSPREDETVLTLHRSDTLDTITAEHSIYVHGEVSSDAPAYVTNNSYLQFTVTPDAGYTIDYAVVMMGQEDITADCYDDGVISIEHVTDDVTVYVFTEYNPSIPDYLCFTALEAGTFTLTIPSTVTTSNLSYVEYSLDGRNWTRENNDSSAHQIDVQVAQGDKVYWRGNGTRMCQSSSMQTNCSIFSTTCRFNVSGNISSLLVVEPTNTITSVGYMFNRLFMDCEYLVSAKDMTIPITNFSNDACVYMFYNCALMESAPTFTASSVGNRCFQYMFQKCAALTDISGITLSATTMAANCCDTMFAGCSSLVSAPTLPATTMATSCYQRMFQDCTSLTVAPTLAATALANSCYDTMFLRCSSLATASALPATTLYKTCYYQMYRQCTSLTTAPDLPATTLAQQCYQLMFYQCSALDYVKCLATDISATDCVANWLNGVSSTGTFVQASGVSWPSGASGIPSTWVKIDKRTMPSGYKQVEFLTPTIGSYFTLTALAMDNHYSVEVAYKGSAEEIADNTHQQQFAGYSQGDSANLKQQTGIIYARQNTGSQIWAQRNAGVYTNPNTGVQSLNSASLTTTKILDTKPHTFKYLPNAANSTIELYIDGTIVATAGLSYYNLANENPIAAGSPYKLYKVTSLYQVQRGSVYYMKGLAADSTTLVTDCVPCIRESDNKVGLYDFVEQTFEEGTGSFTAGAEI